MKRFHAVGAAVIRWLRIAYEIVRSLVRIVRGLDAVHVIDRAGRTRGVVDLGHYRLVRRPGQLLDRKPRSWWRFGRKG